jgi:hypothetical protein
VRRRRRSAWGKSGSVLGSFEVEGFNSPVKIIAWFLAGLEMGMGSVHGDEQWCTMLRRNTTLRMPISGHPPDSEEGEPGTNTSEVI